MTLEIQRNNTDSAGPQWHGDILMPLPIETPPGLDPGIERAVRILNAHGVHTIESCEGGEGHASQEPWIRFAGEYGEGMRALGIALSHGLDVRELRQTYWMQRNGCGRELTGPWWELVLAPTKGV